jgi:hypothetical protein
VALGLSLGLALGLALALALGLTLGLALCPYIWPLQSALASYFCLNPACPFTKPLVLPSGIALGSSIRPMSRPWPLNLIHAQYLAIGLLAVCLALRFALWPLARP